jgi:hypothetical protein
VNRTLAFITATLFGLIETAYFGWNMTPKSETELICDGITLLMAVIALTISR